MISLLILASVKGFASDRNHVDETREVIAEGFITIQVTRGDLRIEGWNRSEVQVEGWLDEQVVEFVFEVVADQTEITVKLPKHLKNWSMNGESDLSIKVPTGSNLDVRGVSTDVSVRGLNAGVKVNNVSGELRVSDVYNGVNLTSVSGDIWLNKSSGRIRARSVSGEIESVDVNGSGSYESVSGNIEVKGNAAELALETVSGEIIVDTGKLVELTGHTVSGDIDVACALSSEGMIDLRSTSGRIDLKLPRQSSARFDLQTGSGGQIRNRLTDDKPKVSKYSRDSALRFVMAEGDGDVTMSTTSGRIVLSR
jgi:DUF4097 and DUF4098 domain-containing protein YvlB